MVRPSGSMQATSFCCRMVAPTSCDRPAGAAGPECRCELEYNNAIRIKTNTRDESDTELICGRLRFEAVPDSFPIAALPETIVLMLGLEKVLGPMRTLVQTIDEELEAARPGAAAVATDLASALFVMMLRGHFEQTASSSDLMKLLASPQSARAVTAMLAAPAHHWTLDELAVQSHVSRATLVRIFRSAIGIAPLTFLAELRLGLARQRLSSTSASLAEVATAVGYEFRECIRASVPKTVRDFPRKIARPAQ